jgi:hypothetical protein
MPQAIVDSQVLRESSKSCSNLSNFLHLALAIQIDRHSAFLIITYGRRLFFTALVPIFGSLFEFAEDRVLRSPK